MNATTQAKLDCIAKYPFCESVGRKSDMNVGRAGNWISAIRLYNSKKWLNCRLMARNALQRALEDKAYSRGEEWNPLIDELRPLVSANVADLVSKIPLPGEMSRKLQVPFSWDITFICLEQEFSDVVTPIFHLPVLDPWYAVGHLPCGWDGEQFPIGWDGINRSGKLIVY